MGILFICPVIGCFGHQEGYSGDNINDKLEQECQILKEKKGIHPSKSSHLTSHVKLFPNAWESDTYNINTNTNT